MIPNGCLLMAVSLKPISTAQVLPVRRMNPLEKVVVATPPKFILQSIAADYQFTLNYQVAKPTTSVSQNPWS